MCPTVTYSLYRAIIYYHVVLKYRQWVISHKQCFDEYHQHCSAKLLERFLTYLIFLEPFHLPNGSPLLRTQTRVVQKFLTIGDRCLDARAIYNFVFDPPAFWQNYFSSECLQDVTAP